MRRKAGIAADCHLSARAAGLGRKQTGSVMSSTPIGGAAGVVLLLGLGFGCATGDAGAATAEGVADDLAAALDLETPTQSVEDYYDERYGGFHEIDEVEVRSRGERVVLVFARDGGFQAGTTGLDLAAELEDDLGKQGEAILHEELVVLTVVTSADGDLEELVSNVRANL